MPETDLYEQLADRLRHAEQYAEAARLMVADARALAETATCEKDARATWTAKEDGDDA